MANLVKAGLVGSEEMTDGRARAEARKMNESSKRRLMAGKQARQQKAAAPVQEGPAPQPTELESDHQTLTERMKGLGGHDRQPVGPDVGRGPTSKSVGKRPIIDVDEVPAPKRPRSSGRVIIVAEDEDLLSTEPVTIAVPPKTVQFENHMILGSQMDLSEVEELPKKLFREEAGRAFRLQALASMDMWLCMNRSITAAERAKRNLELGQSKVAEATKVLQENANLVKVREAAKRQLKATEDKLDEMSVHLEAAVKATSEAEAAKQAIHVALE